MSNAIHTVHILHWDDEPATVYSLPNSLYNFYASRRSSWLLSDPVFDEYIREFTLHPPDTNAFFIKYEIYDDSSAYAARLSMLCKDDQRRFHSSIIVILDITAEIQGMVVIPGIQLFHDAAQMGVPDANRFILSGFPSLLDGQDIPAICIHCKPAIPSEFVLKLTAAFPHELRLLRG
jgi:hypothetical protein